MVKAERVFHLVNMKLLVCFLFAVQITLGSGCFTSKDIPVVSIDQMRFRVAPRVVHIDNRYFLEYQIAVAPDVPQTRYVLASSAFQGKGYYFFAGVTSYPEYGDLVRRPLDADHMETYAQSNSIFWLNPDSSEVRLEVMEYPR